MLLLLLFNQTSEYVALPEIEHLYDPYKTYMASRTIIGDPKDPADERDYQIDWAPLLGEDTIALSLWRVPDGITGESGSNTDTTSTIWVTGGTDGEDYHIINRITTSDDRTFERYLIIPVREL